MALEHNEAEELLARKLIEGLGESPTDKAEEAEANATKKLPPRWEIRVQAKFDPVVEETKAYRTIAKEVDGRYENVKVDTNEGGQSR